MEDNTSVGNDLEMHPSGRNDTPNVVIVDTSSKSPCVDDDELTSDVKEYPRNQEAPPTLGRSSTPSSTSKDASTNGEQEGGSKHLAFFISLESYRSVDVENELA
jgi:hypothetical protein